MLMNTVSHMFVTLAEMTINAIGFPSSHSTNSVSIALYFAQWMLEEREAMGSTALFAGLACTSFMCWTQRRLTVVLAVYIFSVVGGRVYTGMHSLGMSLSPTWVCG